MQYFDLIQLLVYPYSRTRDMEKFQWDMLLVEEDKAVSPFDSRHAVDISPCTSPGLNTGVMQEYRNS